MAPSRPSATSAGGCTRTPMSRACGCCGRRSSRDTASGASPGSRTRNCAASPCRPARPLPRPPIRCDGHRLIPPRSALRCRSTTPSAIDQEIARLAAVLRPLELLRDVLMPVLVQVGDDWHRGRAGIAQEHLMSSTVRHILGSFLRLYAQPDATVRLVFATPSGDRHEIGTLGAAMLAASSGLGVAYLGPDLPAREIVESVTSAGAQVLVLGLTTASAGKATGARTSRDRSRSAEGRRAVGRRARRRAPRRDHQPAGTGPARLPRVPTGARSPRRTRTVMPVRRCGACAMRVSRVRSDRRHCVDLVSTSALAQDTTGVGAIRGVVVNAAGEPARACACAPSTPPPAPPATPEAPFASANCARVRTGWKMLPPEGLPFTSEPVDVRAGLDGAVEIRCPGRRTSSKP